MTRQPSSVLAEIPPRHETAPLLTFHRNGTAEVAVDAVAQQVMCGSWHFSRPTLPGSSDRPASVTIHTGCVITLDDRHHYSEYHRFTQGRWAFYESARLICQETRRDFDAFLSEHDPRHEEYDR